MMGPTKFEYAHTVMGSFLHFDLQTQKMLDALDVSIDFAKNHATYPRSVADMPAIATTNNLHPLPLAQVDGCGPQSEEKSL